MTDPGSPKAPTAPVPVKCISIVLCESIYPVGTSGNLIVVNTFHELTSSGFPTRFPKITVLYTVTNGHGTYDLEIAIVNAATGEAAITVSRPTVLNNPLMIMDIYGVLHQVPLPEPGKYWLEVRCDGALIGQRPFNVVLCPPPASP